MPIQLAFSTVACPDLALPQVIEQAKAFGYQGIELRTQGPAAQAPASPQLAADPANGDPATIRALFAAAGVQALCLSTSVALHYRHAATGRAAAQQALAALDLAASLGCPFVRVFANILEPGQDLRSTLVRIAERTRPIADRAAALGVQLLFENAGHLATAKPWWWLLDLLDHPAVGLCWNVANAAAAGESAVVSVPMLHSRIRLAKVKDARLGAAGGLTQLGDGDVNVPDFVNRLLGIGYRGYLTVEWDRLWLPTLAPAAEFLPEARKRIEGWFDAAAKSQAGGPGDASPPLLPGQEKKPKAPVKKA